MEKLSPAVKRLLLTVFFVVSGISVLFAQTVSYNTSKHTTLPQNEIVVNFTTANGATGLTATGTAAQQLTFWTVKIGGVTVPVTKVTALGLNVLVQFDAHLIAGHSATQTYIKPGEAMTVQYAGGTGAGAIQVTATANFAPAFGPVASVNDAAFNCGLDLNVFKKEVYGTLDQCIPVTMNFTQYCYRLSLRFRNSSNYNLSLIFFTISWGDGSPVANPNPYLSDNFGVANAGYYEDTAFTGSNPDVILTLRPTHTYPSTTTPNNTTGICSWDFSVTPYIGSACSSLAISDVFANYDTDNANSGTLGITPQAAGTAAPGATTTTTDKVCLGTNANMIFSDVTLLNCRTAAPETFTPNQATRNVRIVYGDINAPAPGNIPDMFVQLPATLGGAVVPLTSNVAGGGVRTPAGNVAAGIPVGAFAPTNVGSADANGVITIVPPVTAATAMTYMGRLFTTDPSKQAVNERYYIRMDYWDVCNPYNALTPTNPAPVSIEAYVEIITKPTTPTATATTLCYGAATGALNFSMTTSSTPVTQTKWYNKDPRVAGFTLMTNSNGGTSTNFKLSDYNTANSALGGTATGLNTSRAANAGGIYSVWGTYLVSANSCESDPVEIIYTVRPGLSQPGVITGATEVCVGTLNSPFSVAANPPGTTIAASTFTNAAAKNYTTRYKWSFSNGNASVDATGDSTKAITADFATAGTTTLSVVDQYSTGALCPSTSRTLSITIDPATVGGSVGPNKTICNDGSSTTGTMTLTGKTGSVVKWQRQPPLGVFTDIAGTAGMTTYSEVPAFGAGTYQYRAVVQSGVCATANSAAATITVNPIPGQPTISQDVTSTGLTICEDGTQKTVLKSSNDGNGATYLWYRNGASTGVTSPTITLNTAVQSGNYTVQLFGIPPTACPSPISTPVTVTINPTPTASVTGGGSVCNGTAAPNIVWTLTGKAPFTINYTDGTSSFGPIVVAGTTYTILSPTTPGNYRLTSLVDANTCVADVGDLGGIATVTTQTTPPPTLDSFTGTPAVCDVGAGTNPPDALLDLQPNSVQTYSITYHLKNLNTGVDGPDVTANFTSDAAGVVTISPTYVQMGSAPEPLGYSITITNIFNVTTLCAGLVPIGGPTLIVNPTPAAPTGPVNSIACSSGGGQPLTVNAPAVGFVIRWSTSNPAFTDASGLGTIGGTRNNTFTPTSSATATFFAFTQSNVAPTNCLSASGTAVKQTQDILPTNVNAGAPGSTCTGSYVLTALTPNNGTGTWSGPGAVSFSNLNSPTATVSGLPVATTTLTWTVVSTLGVCTPVVSTVDITRNPLPAAIDPLPQLCEAVAGGGSVPGVLLTAYNDGVTGIVGSTNRTVKYFSDVARLLNVTATPQTINNTTAKIFYTTVQNTLTNCTQNGTITFNVNPLPVAQNQTPSFCEDLPIGSNQHAGVDLTSYNNAITGGAASRTVTWYSDAALTTLVPTPNNYLLVGTQTLYAKVVNTVTTCQNRATITLTTLPRPQDNPILGSGTVCADLSTIVLYQVDPTKNPGSNFTWTVSSVPAAGVFQVFGGGGTNSSNFFILLKFPGTGSVNLSVFETLNGCSGNTSTATITVASAPGAITINGSTSVCSNASGVVYSVPGPNPSSVYTWTVTGATVVGPSSGIGLSSIPVDFGIISPVNIQVKETSTSGCVGAPASVNVLLSPKPAMTSSATSSVCSAQTPALVFTSSVASTFAWKVTSITGAITGTTTGATGTGQLSATFTGAAALRNATGAVGSVTFDVTPTATAAPNCQGPTQSVVLTVNPEPVLVSAQTKTICSGQNASYEILLSPLNLPPGTVFNWPVPVMSDGSSQGSAGVNVPAGSAGTSHITDVLVNTSTSTITARYTVTPSNTLTGCPGSPKDIVITINPEPILASGLDATKCSDVNIGLTLGIAGGSISASGYNITARSVQAGLTAALTNAVVPATGVATNYLANDSYNNVTNTSHLVTYTVVPVSGSGCTGAPKVITITVNPEPVLSNLLDGTVCSDIPIGLTLNTNGSSVAASSYNIASVTIPAGLTKAATNVSVPANNVAANYLANDRYTNTGSTSLTVVYSVVPISGAACVGNPPIPINVTVLPEPVVSSSLNSSVCSGIATGLTLNTDGTSVAAFNYNIISRSITAGLTPKATNANVPATAVGPGYLSADVFTNTGNSPLTVTYLVEPKSGGAGCLGDQKLITITVNPEPVMSNSLDKDVCSHLAIALTLSTNGTSVGAASFNITSRSIPGGLTPNVGNAAVPVNGVAANYLLNDVFTNVTSSILTVTYTVVPVSAAGCAGAAKVISLPIHPEPVMATNLDNAVCSEVPIGLNLATNGSSVAAANYDIVSKVVHPALVSGGGNATVPQNAVAFNYLAGDIYFNSGTVARTVTYTVIPNSADGCAGVAKVITLTVSPEPIVSTTLDATVCSGIATGLTLNTNGTSVAAANYNINGITIPGTLTPAATNAVIPMNGVVVNYLANDKFTNVSALPATVVYNVTPISASGCPGPQKNISITINPEPVVSTGLDGSTCSDIATGLVLATNGASVNAAAWNITVRFVGGGLTIVSGAAVPATGVAANYLAGDTFTNTSALPINVTYTVVPVSAANCTGASKVITITINPEPVLSSSLNTSACSHLATGLTLNTNGISVAAANYNITNRTIAVGLTAGAGNAAVPATGVIPGYLSNDQFTNVTAAPLNVTYTIVPVSAANCSGDSKVVTVIINPEPVVSGILDRTICSDAVSGLTLATDGISVAAASYNVTNISVGAGLTPAAGNATSANGVGVSYLAADKFTNLTAAPVNVLYTVVPVSAGNCIGSPQVITVTVNPEPELSSTLNLTQCSDVATGLTLATKATSVAAQNYNITLAALPPGLTAVAGNASLPANGVNFGYLANDKFNNVGAVPLSANYTVIPVSAAGCTGDPVVVTVTINPEPVVSSSLNNSICSGKVIALTLNTNGTSVAADHYDITSSTVPAALTASGTNAVVPAPGVAANYLANDSYVNTTATPLDVTYTVVPVSAAGCSGDPKIITITINPEPVVANGLDATICSDQAVALTLNTNGSSVAAANYNITAKTVDPALTGASGNVTVPATAVAANYLATDKYTNVGTTPANVTYTVEPVSAAGCKGATKIITITINPEPVVVNGLDAFICSDLPIALTLNTVVTSVAAANYNIVSRTAAAPLVAAGTNVVVPANGVAANYLVADKFTNTTTSSQTVVYIVAPVSALGCVGDQKTITMTIQPEPVIVNGLDGTKCSGIATALVLSTTGSSVAAANYNVTIITVPAGLTPAGGNATVANGVAANYLANDKFTNTGATSLDVVYTVVPVSAAGCTGDPKIITITINPEPVVATNLDATVCSDIATALTLNTNGVSVAAATYDVTGVAINPSLTPDPGNAAFPATGVAANYLASDKFTNTSAVSASVAYTVRAKSAAGCFSAPQVITITINPEPVLSSTLSKTACSDAPGGITLNTNGTSVGAANYNITGVVIPAGLTVVSAAAVPATGVAANYLVNDTYTNVTNGNLDVLYTVVPVSGATCVGDPVVVRQTVTPKPVLANLNKTVCSDNAISLTLASNGTSTAATTFDVTLLTVPPGLTLAGTNVSIPGIGVSSTYLFNDMYTNHGNLPLDVQYTVTPISAIGCKGDPVIVVITINPEPVLSPTLDRTVCSDAVSGITLNTNGTSVAASSYNVTSIVVAGGLTPKAGNATPANGVVAGYLANDQFTNKTNGALTVKYTVVPVTGSCSGDPLDVTLTVNPEPVMDPALASSTICSSAKTNIILATNGSSVAAATFNVTLVSKDAGLTGTPTVGAGLTSAAINNDVFVNVTTIPLKVVYQIVPVSAGNCLGDPFNISVTVNAEPVINPALDNTVCSRDITGIILSTNGTSVAANQYVLASVTVPGTITADPANQIAGATSGINLIKNDKYTNTTSAAVIVTYSVYGISPQNCQGQPQTIHLTVNPEPILTPGTANLCSDVPSGIVLGAAGGSAPITQYILKGVAKAAALVAGPSNAALGTYNVNNFLAGDTFTNTTSGPLVVTYTIAPVAAGCVGADQTVVFTVNPAPAVASNLNKTACTNDASGIVLATETSPLSVPAASYNIISVTIDAGLTQTAGNTGPRNGVTANEVQNDKFQNPGNTILKVTYKVVAVSGSACLGPAKDVVLTVEPTIKATPANNKPDICSNDVTDIDLISPTIPSSGVISFNYTAVSSVGGLISGFVPSATNLPANSKITDNLINNSASPATVTYTVTAVANGAKGGTGCVGVGVPVIVTVEPKPKLVATPLIQTVCEGAPTSIALTTNTVPTAGTIHFNVISTVPTGGMTLTSAAPPAFYTSGQSISDTWSNPTTTVQTVTYTLQPVVSGGLGCQGDQVTITVNVNPLPTLTNSPQAPICSNDFINITLTSDVANTINTWTATVTAGTVTGAAAGAGDLIFQTLKNTGTIPATVRYTVTPKASGCLGTPLLIDVVVNPLAEPANVPATQKVCYGGTLNVPLTSAVAGATFSWTVDPFPNSMGVPQTGSGNVINQVLSNPTGAQDFLTYTITATGPGATACASQPKVMTVIAAPQIDAFFLNPDTWLCKGNKDFLQIQLNGQAPFELVYTDGATNFTLTNVGNFKSIQIQPLQTTTYKLVSVKDAFGCSFTPNSQVVFTVGDTDAAFSVVGATSSCSPYQVSLTYNQKAGTEYTWRWGDGVADSVYTAAADVNNVIVKHTYTNSSPTATLKPKITLQTDLPAPFPGCFKSTTQTINVYPTIMTNVFPDKTELCSGESVRFTNQSFGVSATGNRWFYRVKGNVGQELDVRTTKNVNYTMTNTTATNPIIYEVIYQSTNGNCPAPDVVTEISVYRGVVAAFDSGGTSFVMNGNDAFVTFNNTSDPIDASQFTYDWDFGQDATPSTFSGVGPITVDFTTLGPRDVVLTVTNIDANAAGLSCGSQYTQQILIKTDPPVAAFVAEPPLSCFPATIVVTQNNCVNADLYEWRLIDNNGRLAGTSNAPKPEFLVNTPGKFDLSLKATNSITGDVAVAPVQSFTVYDRPLASFDVRPDIVYVPDTELNTFNFSFGATDYFWDFGDNGTSTDFQPSYTYKIEGKYDITLIAKNDHGGGVVCADTLKREILAKEGGLTKVPNAFTPNPNGPNGGVSTNGSFNDVFLPIVKGVEEFNMQIYDRWGNMIFESNSSTIGWDGYNKDGKLMPAGVYVYKLTVRLSDNQRSTQIGDVTMIR